ncbi:MAG: DUF4317 family protein [Oscillospiraceae bacterium]|nr:DUF4317 family protein [Oscillospiraceae bacterium]
MNSKEVNEIKRCFRPDKTAVKHIYGCYVNTNREIIDRIDASLGMLPEEETAQYLDRLRKVLSGALGKNLIDIVFSPEQVNDSDEHRLLMALRDSKAEDPEVREEFFQKVVDSYEAGDQNYLILLASDSYDVPRKRRDGADGDSENVYTFVICALCPVKDGGAGLRYDHEDSMFHISGAGQLAGPPSLGFLFPAFDYRTSNINNALYFAKKPDEMHEELIDALFRTEPPMSSTAQREAFHTALADTLEEDFHYDVMQTVHEQLWERMEQHKEEKDPEPLALTVREIGDILSGSGVSEEHVTAFREACKEQFGEQAVLDPANLIDMGKLEIITPDAKIIVNPETSYMIETRMINGRKYILIPADQGVEVNGLNMAVRPEAGMPAEEAPSEETPSEETPAEETSAEKTPAEEVPPEEAADTRPPWEEAPAPEAE